MSTKRISYDGEVWKKKNREYNAELLKLLTSKDCLIVLSHGKPPYKVILGVPHQAVVGEKFICENGERRKSDENAASYALVTFTLLREHDIPCKLVIAAHSTTFDPNKELSTPYCQEIFSERCELLIECHGAGLNRILDLELSAGQNNLSDPTEFGERLASALQQRYSLGVQKQCGSVNALIFQKDEKKTDGALENPANLTNSLIKAQEEKIPALHLEAKPQFRKLQDRSNSVTDDGLVLGRGLAQAIIKGWISEELKKVEQGYCAKVLNMTGAYNREIERTKEYHGRQLLELLQNADDEAEKAEGPSMLIKLEADKLIVANSGTPFSKQGVLSLMYSDNSPKIKRRNKIGYKGLGFRAVLNWSHSIWIKSGVLSIEFSKQNAVSFLNSLLEKNPGLEQDVEDVSTEKYPIATLSVPTCKDAEASEYSEYDTYVVLNFSSEEVRSDIQRQINELGIEIALFLNNLRKIKLQSPERNETIMKIPPPDGKNEYEEVQLLDNSGKVLQSRKWRIYSKSDELPENLRQAEGVKQYEYDLRIAVGEKLDDNINRLFSYFKTEVKFPFPAIIHGTFDLDGNRNHLNLNPINEFLLGQLAELMIETAVNLTQTTDQVNWDAVKLLAKKGEFDDKVEQMGFYNKLLSSMKTHKLIPVLSNKYMSPAEGPIFYEAAFARILNKAASEFPNLALHTEDSDICSLVKELGLKKYKPEDFTNKLNKTSPSLSIIDRAELILLIANNYGACFYPLNPGEMPGLFIDEEGGTISSKIQTLLPPERSKFQLPKNIRIVFVSTELSNILKVKANSKTVRALAERLTCFNVHEYRFDTVIRRVVGITNNLIKKNESRTGEYIRNMVNSLVLIFSDDSDPEKKLPETINVPLLTRAGKLKNSREIYFGQEYSAGKIMDALYSEIDGAVFLAKKEDLGLENVEDSKATDFLKWIGVVEFPRIKQKALEGETYDSEYEDHVLRNLNYPYQTTWGDSYVSYEALKADKSYRRSKINIGSIEELDDILKSARFEDILAWLYRDLNLQTILKDGRELSGSSFSLDLSGKHYYRNLRTNEISSNILWVLRKTEWIMARSGRKVRPEVCCLSKTLTADMSPLIEVPAYNIKDGIFKAYNIKEEDIEYILEKIGASRDFASLPDETIYGILTKLESADPEGKKAQVIYRQIIHSKPIEWARNVADSKARNKFVQNGKLFARAEGGSRYFPVKDVYYVDNITFCKEIMNKFPIAQIDRRSGKEQVRQIFGAKPLEDVKFSLASAPETHSLNAAFGKALESFKPYILVYRLQKPTLKTELNKLKGLKIVLCNKISATYKYDSGEQALKINPFEHVQVGDDNTAYLLMDQMRHYKDLNDLKSDFNFCDSIAEVITGILKVSENQKDYRDLFSKDRQQRDLVIQRDLDDTELEKLKQARELFHSLSDLELEFWQAILETKGISENLAEHASDKDIINLLAKELQLHEEFLVPIYEGIYYEKYSAPSNIQYIKQLFEALDITIEEFNQYSPEPIDFTEHLTTEITSEKYKLLRRFKSYLYRLLKDKPIDLKETYNDLVKAFEAAPIAEYYDINKELTLDKSKYFNALFESETFKSPKLVYSDLLQQEETDLEEEYRKNLNDFKKRIGESGNFYAEDLHDFLESLKNNSLLLFGEYGELESRFNQKYSRPPKGKEGGTGQAIEKQTKKIDLNGKEEEFEEDNYGPLVENMDEDLKYNEYEIFSGNPLKPAEKLEAGHKKGRGGGKGGTQSKQTKETGFVGEYYVYNLLVKKYSKEKVLWVSEYAKIANINPNGSDAEGYDIRYLDEKDKVHYVEVKASINEDCSFPISSPEVRFGEQNKSSYEVIIVQNALTNNRKAVNLGNIFEYEEDESFNSNRKFSVENDGFRIRFEI